MNYVERPHCTCNGLIVAVGDTVEFNAGDERRRGKVIDIHQQRDYTGCWRGQPVLGINSKGRIYERSGWQCYYVDTF